MLSDLAIAGVFNSVFGEASQEKAVRPEPTLLVGGFAEPSYLPPSAKGPAEVRYTLDYAASALHEAAHWLQAGPHRRQLFDYGYWYVSEPRPAAVQRAFLRVEARVQALESVLSADAGLAFRASVDDFAMSQADRARFEAGVLRLAARRSPKGWPRRVERLRAALRAASKNTPAVDPPLWESTAGGHSAASA